MVVQYLLNCVPRTQGGPMRELVVDGKVNSLTLQAIQRFQAWNGGTSDGRVDPKGPTLAKLQGFDPYPQEPFNPVGISGGKTSDLKHDTPYGKTSGGPLKYETPYGKTNDGPFKYFTPHR